MQTVSSILALRATLSEWRLQGDRIAFVPTMGSLHRGHISLVERARAEADRVVASVFVNQLQFGPDEDYDSYPRTLEQDQLALEEADADLLFAPSTQEMYPGGKELDTRVEVKDVSNILCGAYRPGFFQGVATVVAKLFNIVQPDTAIFGKKDYQQWIVIQRMVEELSWPIVVVGAETVRESDGLAMSSRNAYLTDQERVTAPLLYEGLLEISACITNGDHNYAQIEQATMAQLGDSGFRPDYVRILRRDTLGTPQRKDQHLVALAAAWLGKARLIDNIEISIS